MWTVAVWQSASLVPCRRTVHHLCLGPTACSKGGSREQGELRSLTPTVSIELCYGSQEGSVRKGLGFKVM